MIIKQRQDVLFLLCREILGIVCVHNPTILVKSLASINNPRVIPLFITFVVTPADNAFMPIDIEATRMPSVVAIGTIYDLVLPQQELIRFQSYFHNFSYMV